jgi:hypothetical protein
VRRLLGMFGTLALALAAGTLVPAAGASAGVNPPPTASSERFGVRLVDVPVSEAKNPRALRYIIDYLPPGTVIHRRIMILNQETHRAHFTVYADAAQIKNGYFVGDAGATRSELTGWIRIRHRRVTLPAQSSVMDMVTIRVPRHATRGEHYGVIWVQQVAHARTARGTELSEIARVGVRIYLAVGRGGAPPTDFSITSITGHRSAQGQPLITALVRNDGGRAIDLAGTVRLTGGPGGTSAGPFQLHQIITLAPGQSGTVTFMPSKRLPSGPWQARLSLVSGLTTRTASAIIQFSGQSAGMPGALPLMIGAAFLLFGLAILVWLRRKPQGRRAAGRRQQGAGLEILRGGFRTPGA